MDIITIILLMICCYIHKLPQLKIFIREASICIRVQLTQKLITAQGAEKRLECLVLYEKHILLIFIPLQVNCKVIAENKGLA